MSEQTQTLDTPSRRVQGLLKSSFVGVFPMFASAAAGIAVWKIVEYGPLSQWWGVLGAALSFLVFLGYLFLGNTGRTSANLPWVLSVATLSLIATGALGMFGNYSLVPIALSSVLLVGVYLYVFWYSRLSVPQNDALAVGNALPDFQLEDAEGNSISSRDLSGKPTVFLFFRGNWCPLCVAQIREVSAQYRELAKRGAEVVLISPQPHDNTRSLSKRFDAPMRFLVDPKARAARTLGLLHEAGLPMGFQALGYDSDTVLPTVIITGSTLRILWLSQTDNYRVRPEPETFLQVLDEAGAT